MDKYIYYIFSNKSINDIAEIDINGQTVKINILNSDYSVDDVKNYINGLGEGKGLVKKIKYINKYRSNAYSGLRKVKNEKQKKITNKK